ncbi:MAG: GAF domain-containing protein [Anaerolineae bacterium]
MIEATPAVRAQDRGRVAGGWCADRLLPRTALAVLLVIVSALYPVGVRAASSTVVGLGQRQPGNVPMLAFYHTGQPWTDRIVETVQRVVMDPQQNPLEKNPLADSTEIYADSNLVIVNQPTPFFERYGPAIGVGAVIALLIAVVAILLLRRNVRRHREAELALRRSNDALERAKALVEAQAKANTADLERRLRRLQTALTVTRTAAGIREPEALMRAAAELISERFGYGHIGIFLIDENDDYAVLQAASSQGGRRLLAQGYRLRVGREGLVGQVAERGEAQIALDVSADEVWRSTPELAQTRSQMALPLKRRDEVIGVLDVQSEEPGAFSSEDLEVLGIVADHLALAIDSARRLEESRLTIERLTAAYGERVDAIWQTSSLERGYAFDGLRVIPLEGDGEAPVAARGTESVETAENQLVVPIPLRGQTIGTIVLEREPVFEPAAPENNEAPSVAKGKPWTAQERALAENIAAQAGLSLEMAYLLNETRVRAQRERVFREITANVRQTLDIDLILQTALREVGENLGISNIEVRMGSGEERDV